MGLTAESVSRVAGRPMYKSLADVWTIVQTVGDQGLRYGPPAIKLASDLLLNVPDPVLDVSFSSYYHLTQINPNRSKFALTWKGVWDTVGWIPSNS